MRNSPASTLIIWRISEGPRLFREALAQLRDLGELVNRALEIDVDGDALIRRIYRLARIPANGRSRGG